MAWLGLGLLAACGGGSATAPGPAVPLLQVSASNPRPNEVVGFQVGNIPPTAPDYAWNFGDGSTATGSTAEHSYVAEGQYRVTLTATDTAGRSSHASAQVTVAYLPPATPAIDTASTTQYTAQVFTLQGFGSDPNGLPLSYAWSFGDAATASGNVVSHAYSAPGTYAVTLTITNTAGRSAAGTVTLTVLAPATAVIADNTLAPACSGSLCAAVAPGIYAGSGIGIWSYNNSTTTDASIDVKIAGVHAGLSVTLAFSNAQASDAATLPSAGTAATVSASPAATRASARMAAAVRQQQLQDPWHEAMLERNHALVERFLAGVQARVGASGSSAASGSFAASASADTPAPDTAATLPAAMAAPPAPGTARTWNDNFDGSSTPYTATVQYTCALPTGRNAVFWVDPDVTAAGRVTAADLAALENGYCGAAGGYARLVNLLGDVWGSGAAPYATQLIQDTPALQDINIVVLQVPEATGWGGYFSAENNFLATAQPASNQALAFFINGTNLPGNASYYVSTLLHESTHMIDFYQRTVVRGQAHDTWLEETAAMMTEDIVAPAINGGYSTVPARLYGYLQTGGGVSYIDWVTLAQEDYDLGASFGAFLDRRYGLAIYQQLITSCNDGVGHDSYSCLDGLIRANGGGGLAEDFARQGASSWAGLPAAGVPWGFGYPATASGGYILAALDTAAMISARPAATALSSYPATTQTYQADTAAGNPYERDGVVVPAGTRLMVVVQ